ncbi:hypothetical protein KCU73_g3435, partial [Aureobasidium melanogenum]
MEYSHTPPTLRPKSSTAYTTLSSASSISSFHTNLNAKLNTAISTGAIKANQVGVKERSTLNTAALLARLLQAASMDIQFDPFSFGVATFALAVAVIQLYWNRPQNRDIHAASNDVV